jgi:hypothetical protein
MSCRVPSEAAKGERVSLVFRPEDVLIHTAPQPSGINVFPGVLERVIFVGNRIHCEIRSGALLLHSEANARTVIQQGSKVFVEVPADYIRVLRA